MTAAWWEGLGGRAWKRHSQTGEEGIIEAILAGIGESNRFAVDIGASDGFSNSNTRFLHERGWHVVGLEGNEELIPASDIVHHAWVTEENVNVLLDQHGVPTEPDVLSIDLDGQDWWIWRAMARRPRLVVVEINGAIGLERAVTIERNPTYRWSTTDDYYGASLAAFRELGRLKGYHLVHQQLALNAFFVQRELLPANYTDEHVLASFAPMQGHAPDTLRRQWVAVG